MLSFYVYPTVAFCKGKSAVTCSLLYCVQLPQDAYLCISSCSSDPGVLDII